MNGSGQAGKFPNNNPRFFPFRASPLPLGTCVITVAVAAP